MFPCVPCLPLILPADNNHVCLVAMYTDSFVLAICLMKMRIQGKIMYELHIFTIAPQNWRVGTSLVPWLTWKSHRWGTWLGLYSLFLQIFRAQSIISIIVLGSRIDSGRLSWVLTTVADSDMAFDKSGFLWKTFSRRKVVHKSWPECDIRENFDTNECPNIFVSTKLHEWISEYIHTNFFDTNECPNKYSYWKLHEYSNIFEYSSRFYTLTHSPTNVRIYSYKQIWHERMSEYIRKRKIDTNKCPNIYSWPIYSNIRIF